MSLLHRNYSGFNGYTNSTVQLTQLSMGITASSSLKVFKCSLCGNLYKPSLLHYNSTVKLREAKTAVIRVVSLGNQLLQSTVEFYVAIT